MKYFIFVGAIATTLNGILAILTKDYGYAIGLFAGAAAFLILFAKIVEDEKAAHNNLTEE